MSLVIQQQQLPAIGAPFEGGFFGGVIQINGSRFAVAWAPKAEGEGRFALLPDDDAEPVALSCCDSVANTRALALVGSAAAIWAQALRIGGHDDWCVAARDVLELAYRHFKPGTAETCCSFRDGDNPSSVPPGYCYVIGEILQTSVADFQKGGAQAFEERWYWSSTQAGSGAAWGQHFYRGSQLGYYALSAEGAVRAVRLISLSA